MVLTLRNKGRMQYAYCSSSCQQMAAKTQTAAGQKLAIDSEEEEEIEEDYSGYGQFEEDGGSYGAEAKDSVRCTRIKEITESKPFHCDGTDTPENDYLDGHSEDDEWNEWYGCIKRDPSTIRPGHPVHASSSSPRQQSTYSTSQRLNLCCRLAATSPM